MMITSETKIFALMGDPVKGSLSPAIHNSAFKAMGMDSVYVAFRVPRAHLADAIAGIRALGITGLNVTHPHKIAIMNFLDELDESAKSVMAVNTVKNERGKLTGFNTDGMGAVKALEKEVGALKGKRVVILGAGGAARAIAFALLKKGAELTIANRTLSNAIELKRLIEKKLGKTVDVIGIKRKELKNALSGAHVLINATTVGMSPNVDQTLVTADMMHRGLIVNDIVYKPLRTRLLREAKKAGAKPITGIGMLVHQAALAIKIWTNREPPVEVMMRAAERELRRGENY